MGESGARDARARRAIRIGVDLRRRCSGSRTADADDAARRLPLPSIDRSTDDLRHRRRLGLALGLAGDAQRRVPRRAASTRSICRCRRRAPTTSSRSAARSAAGRQRHDSVQGVAVRRVDEVVRRRAPHRRDQHDPRRRRPLARRQHRRGRLSRAAAASACRSTALRVAVLGAGGAARAVAVALASSGCASHGARAQPRRRPTSVAALRPVDVGPWPPAPGSWDLLVNCTPVGMYPHVDETPLAGRALLTGRCVYDLIYNPPVTRLLREAAARGLPDDRRPRDARRPGAASSSSGGPARRPRAGCHAGGRADGGLRSSARDENHVV